MFFWTYTIIDLSIYVLSHIQLFVTPWTVYPIRCLCPWNFPGKNTRMGCHFLLQEMFRRNQKKVLPLFICIYIYSFLLVVFKSFSLSCCSVAKSSPTLHIPMNCSTLGFPVSYNFPEFTQFYVH